MRHLFMENRSRAFPLKNKYQDSFINLVYKITLILQSQSEQLKLIADKTFQPETCVLL